MGRLRYFRIKLENNDSGIYFGGDTVQGKLLVGLEGDGKKARGTFTYQVNFKVVYFHICKCYSAIRLAKPNRI